MSLQQTNAGETATAKLSDALSEIVAPAYKIRAILQGAIALLYQAEGLADPDGDVFSARQLIEEAWALVNEIYGDKEIALRSRLEKIEGVAA